MSLSKNRKCSQDEDRPGGPERRSSDYQAGCERARNRSESERKARDRSEAGCDLSAWSRKRFGRILCKATQSSCVSPKRVISSKGRCPPRSREESYMLHWKTRVFALMTLASSFAALGGFSRWW